jgi:hypothetical protein
MPRLEREVVIAAHRGMAAGYPENTLAAFYRSGSRSSRSTCARQPMATS